MDRKILMFDGTLKTRSGRRIPWTDEQTTGNDDDSNIVDQSLHWFHEGYGSFQLYRLHQIDDTRYYICEPLHKYCSTSSENWDRFTEDPELALKES